MMFGVPPKPCPGCGSAMAASASWCPECLAARQEFVEAFIRDLSHLEEYLVKYAAFEDVYGPE